MSYAHTGIEQADAKSLLTPRDLAGEWECSPEFVTKLCRSGKLRAVRLGRLWRIRRADADEFITRGGTAACE